MITGQSVTITYNGDGFNRNFVFPNYLYALADLNVQTTVAGVTTTMVLGTDYNIADPADSRLGTWPTGVTVVFVVAPVAGASVSLSRSTTHTQATTFVDNNPFPAATLENGIDKLTAMIQEVTAHFKGSAAGPPTSLATPYVAGDWLINLSPVAGGFIGWVCTSAGSPGTWNAFGMVSL